MSFVSDRVCAREEALVVFLSKSSNFSISLIDINKEFILQILFFF